MNRESGERLILTKPIDTGIIATAVKGKLADKKAIKILINVTSAFNRETCNISF